jgi:hypothetical protein
MPEISTQPVNVMTLISRLKSLLYSRTLQKFHATNLNKVPVDHFSAIRTVGILLDASDSRHCRIIRDYQQKLTGMGVTSQLLGYYNSRVVDDPPDFPFFTAQQLSFAYIPKAGVADEFINTPFDVLINLDMKMHKPLSYIAAASKALFKIGPANGDHRHYDLMIHTPDGDLEKYLEEIRATFNKIQG